MVSRSRIHGRRGGRHVDSRCRDYGRLYRVTGFVLRFLGAGALVAALPWVAGRSNDRLAGLLLLFPAVTLCGFLVLGLERGTRAVADAAGTAAVTLPVVLLFLLVVHLTAKAGLPLPAVLGVALGAWLAGASLAAILATR